MWTSTYVQPVVFGVRVPKTKWVALVWPTSSMAQQAGVSTQAFEDFYFKVCTLDYPRMRKASEPLMELIGKTNDVRVTGPGTDLKFSIAGLGAESCSGDRNIPDGECYTAPVRESMEGTISYNTVSLNQGVEFKNIVFKVQKGNIVEAEAGPNTAKLNEILDTDEGARYFGEFSFGYNPHILHPMKNTLFDEKIAGSFHLTPGNAYPGIADNGNKSAVHWDLVNIQRPDYGGGEIWFDGRLIRKDGLFVVPELAGLNPDQLSR
jgi:aminopeptidase